MIGGYIKHYRESMGYTQAELVTRIQTIHHSFSSLDEITLSRWENGHTKPSKKKQIALLIFFDFLEDVNKLYADEKLQSAKLEKTLSKRYKNVFSQNDGPYMVGESKIKVGFFDSIPTEKLTFYSQYLKNVNNIDVDLTTLEPQKSLYDGVGLYEFYSGTGILLGHFFYVIANNTVISELMGEKVVGDDGSSLYIVTTYSSSKSIFMYRNFLILEALLTVSVLPKSLFVKSSLGELSGLFESINAEVVTKGDLVEDGVKFGNNRYNWLLYKVSTINLLSSKEFYFDEKLIEEQFSIIENLDT
ncbi:helix-turn-helix domain-containing protein [Shewanella sp. 10N.261.52.F9]|uniref:helix-turn-helix domain-containing protein n=1 Tax=Shewanella sp. 10N.261.52.F9 TaxID=3229684 RepID=UPI00354B1D81